ALAILVQAPLIGVPNDATLGFDSLLYALAAALVARMERMGVAVLAGMGVGVLVSVSISRTGSGDLSTALMLFVVLGALLVFHRRALSRAEDSGVSTWEMVKSFRPVPTELRDRLEVT